MRVCVNAVPPKTVVSISRRGVVQNLTVRRPVGKIVTSSLGDRDPFAFRRRFRSIGGRDRDAPEIRLSADRKADPLAVGRKPAINQVPGGMFEQRGLLVRCNIQKVIS
jgi:hypothetical protein